MVVLGGCRMMCLLRVKTKSWLQVSALTALVGNPMAHHFSFLQDIESSSIGLNNMLLKLSNGCCFILVIFVGGNSFLSGSVCGSIQFPCGDTAGWLIPGLKTLYFEVIYMFIWLDLKRLLQISMVNELGFVASFASDCGNHFIAEPLFLKTATLI
ncbi:Uncharacterized protein Adt_17477 [Abeliophyllum distichum]|uniref:Uncharacterized protein n=1 Tax=Abeliophyllum distichum TaxID=126358 RepID=A0ABD1TGK6_9LAMI